MTEQLLAWGSYGKIYAVGHRAIANIFLEPVIVEEKLDGSQFSFGVINGELKARSKGAELVIDEPEKMFGAGIEVVKSIAHLLKPNWVYRGEYFQRPKHNTLAYVRIPEQHIMIFDISPAYETFLDYTAKREEAKRIGLETAPLLFEGMVTSAEQFKDLLNITSVLGGQRIEGVVVKNYARFGIDGRVMMAKFVSEAFKEIHQGEFRKQNPTGGDIIEKLVFAYRTPARWEKAIQHLRDAGTLENDPKDIGPLLREINKDVLAECEAEIKDKLMDWAWSKIARGITAGFPTWYKERLVADAFGGGSSGVEQVAVNHPVVGSNPTSCSINETEVMA